MPSPKQKKLQYPSGIRDNHDRGSVGDFLEDKIKEGSTLSFVSAYFTIYAYNDLKNYLDKIESLRFLFGEPRFIRSLDPTKTDKKAFKIEDEGLSLSNRLEQKRVARDCAEWIKTKVEIRSLVKPNFLHGKLYHIDNKGVEKAILGSSNFTMHGLGLGEGSPNIELNLEVNDHRDLEDLKVWFDDLWNNQEGLVEDVKEEVLRYLGQLYQNHSPEFIYFKTLYHLFKQFLSEQATSGLLAMESQIVDTEIWKSLFEFQRDGVKGAINKINNYNGCIIADSVGLGKTYEALAVIKYFELRNNRVLVLCPKKLRENWTIYQAQNNSEFNPFVKDRFSYTVLSHTDLSRESGKAGDIDLATISWGNYDLVVIDESHNFRNNTKGRRDEDGNIIRKSRYERLMEDVIKSGVNTKVLLLSATPVNNDLRDLRNQLYLLTEGRDDAFRDKLGITSLKDTLVVAQRNFNEWAKKTQPRDPSLLLEKLSSAFFHLLDELTIARSRKHILRYYSKYLTELGGFPTRLKPKSIYAEIDLKNRFMSYDTLNEGISKYSLSLFNPTHYLLPEHRQLYQTSKVQYFSQEDREYYLIGMMKVNFLKRLESSVHSFTITMERTIQKIEELEATIIKFKQARNANATVDVDPTDALGGLDDEELEEAWKVGKKLTFALVHLNVDAWLKDLQKDKQQLSVLMDNAAAVSTARDAKLADLKKLIEAKAKAPTTNKQGEPNPKMLVFTAFADTAIYLYESLQPWVKNELKLNIALVTGGTGQNRTTFGKNEFNQILLNFSPRAKKRDKISSYRQVVPQTNEIDILIATDCISEGQNLQDCDTVVNYDIHWNPVRLIQRFGRIDRIGSQNEQVQMINFWPTKELNKYINLQNRVEARMALVDITATFEDNLLAPSDELKTVIADELKYRDIQLLRLKDEVLDLEDFNESVTLSEFTLDDFRMELEKFIGSNRQALEEAPYGLYALVPVSTDPAYSWVVPGVIYCLRQKGDTDSNREVNPLQPYFLAYVRNKGGVRFGFAQPKQILDLYSNLCQNKASAYENLCNIFDTETKDGTEMTFYTELLNQAVESFSGTFKKRAVAGLQSGRDGTLIAQSKQVRSTSDFELISWLVIK
jgi:SNF2 family DNA or RNA helicase